MQGESEGAEKTNETGGEDGQKLVVTSYELASKVYISKVPVLLLISSSTSDLSITILFFFLLRRMWRRRLC